MVKNKSIKKLCFIYQELKVNIWCPYSVHMAYHLNQFISIYIQNEYLFQINDMSIPPPFCLYKYITAYLKISSEPTHTFNCFKLLI